MERFAEARLWPWNYDGLGRVVEETDELAGMRYFSCNAAGVFTRLVDRRGWVRQFAFDIVSASRSFRMSCSGVCRFFRIGTKRGHH